MLNFKDPLPDQRLHILNSAQVLQIGLPDPDSLESVSVDGLHAGPVPLILRCHDYDQSALVFVHSRHDSVGICIDSRKVTDAKRIVAHTLVHHEVDGFLPFLFSHLCHVEEHHLLAKSFNNVRKVNITDKNDVSAVPLPFHHHPDSVNFIPVQIARLPVSRHCGEQIVTAVSLFDCLSPVPDPFHCHLLFKTAVIFFMCAHHKRPAGVQNMLFHQPAGICPPVAKHFHQQVSCGENAMFNAGRQPEASAHFSGYRNDAFARSHTSLRIPQHQLFKGIVPVRQPAVNVPCIFNKARDCLFTDSSGTHSHLQQRVSQPDARQQIVLRADALSATPYGNFCGEIHCNLISLCKHDVRLLSNAAVTYGLRS